MTIRTLHLGLAVLALSLATGGAQAQPVSAAPVDPCAKPPNRVGEDRLLPLGCAMAANLRAMIADPADLDHGRDLSPAAGDAAFAAATRHRKGEVKPLYDSDAGQATPAAAKTGGK